MTIHINRKEDAISTPELGTWNPAYRFILVMDLDRNGSAAMPPGSEIIQSFPVDGPTGIAGSRYLDRQNVNYDKRFIILWDKVLHLPPPQCWTDAGGNLWRPNYCHTTTCNLHFKYPMKVIFKDIEGGEGLLPDIQSGAIYLMVGSNGKPWKTQVQFTSRIGWSEKYLVTLPEDMEGVRMN